MKPKALLMGGSDALGVYLTQELSALPADHVWPKNPVNDKMDAYLEGVTV